MREDTGGSVVRNNKRLKLNNLSAGYKNGKEITEITREFSTEALQGMLIYIIGPNGSGKSTLLKTISGLLRPLAGSVVVSDDKGSENIYSMNHQSLSKSISVILTRPPDAGLLTVYDVASMGRAPYTDWRNRLDEHDISIIQNALAMTGADKYSDKLFSQLSDGEKQKVMTARALAQDTDFMCMDEPASFLDLPSRIELTGTLEQIRNEKNKTLIVTTHDLDSALRTADMLWVIMKNGIVKSGIPEDLALDGTIGKVFGSGRNIFNLASGRFEVLPADNHAPALIQTPALIHASIEGAEPALSWTRRSFERCGIHCMAASGNRRAVKIAIKQTGESEYEWHSHDRVFKSLADLISWMEIDTAG